MKRPLKIGERVCVYETKWDGGGSSASVTRYTGFVEHSVASVTDLICIKLDKAFYPQVRTAAHPKSCIRLKKKEKKKPIDCLFWVASKSALNEPDLGVYIGNSNDKGIKVEITFV